MSEIIHKPNAAEWMYTFTLACSRLLLLLLLLLSFHGYFVSGDSDTTIPAVMLQDDSPDVPRSSRRMPGSFAAIPQVRHDPRVRAVARFAVRAVREQQLPPPYAFVMDDSSLVEEDATEPVVVRGWQQVVAGLNYKLAIVLVKVPQRLDVDDGTKRIASTSTATATTSIAPEWNDIVGGFSVTVYDHFGELSVTKWGNEISLQQAKAMLENVDEFGEGDAMNMNPFDE